MHRLFGKKISLVESSHYSTSDSDGDSESEVVADEVKTPIAIITETPKEKEEMSQREVRNRAIVKSLIRLFTRPTNDEYLTYELREILSRVCGVDSWTFIRKLYEEYSGVSLDTVAFERLQLNQPAFDIYNHCMRDHGMPGIDNATTVGQLLTSRKSQHQTPKIGGKSSLKPPTVSYIPPARSEIEALVSSLCGNISIKDSPDAMFVNIIKGTTVMESLPKPTDLNELEIQLSNVLTERKEARSVLRELAESAKECYFNRERDLQSAIHVLSEEADEEIKNIKQTRDRKIAIAKEIFVDSASPLKTIINETAETTIPSISRDISACEAAKGLGTWQWLTVVSNLVGERSLQYSEIISNFHHVIKQTFDPTDHNSRTSVTPNRQHDQRGSTRPSFNVKNSPRRSRKKISSVFKKTLTTVASPGFAKHSSIVAAEKDKLQYTRRGLWKIDSSVIAQFEKTKETILQMSVRSSLKRIAVIGQKSMFLNSKQSDYWEFLIQGGTPGDTSIGVIANDQPITTMYVGADKLAWGVHLCPSFCVRATACSTSLGDFHDRDRLGLYLQMLPGQHPPAKLTAIRYSDRVSRVVIPIANSEVLSFRLAVIVASPSMALTHLPKARMLP